jgi:diguanylate cyclase (GGDEF)-like protein
VKTNITRTFAALSATNEAILYAKSPEELYEQVSKAAFSSGDFLATAVFLLEPGTDKLRFAAGFGEDIKRLCRIDITIAANTPEGSGVCGQAFRDRKISISNDFLNDARSLAWRQGASAGRVGAAAALPLTCNGRSVGVLLVTMREAGSLDDETVSLLERMSANISYALDNFDREAARARLSRMFAALSATNEAIMRAKSRTELFELVCEAAANGGRFTSTSIGLVRPNEEFLEIVAAAGPIAAKTRTFRLSVREDTPRGGGLTGIAFRSRRACISNDYLNDPRGAAFHESSRRDGSNAVAAFPLFNGGEPIGILLFCAAEKGAFTPGSVDLLQRIADNIAFALDNFDRADEKTKADERIEYLASHDSLTGLPNRDMFNGLLHAAMLTATRRQLQFALLFIDLDRFKIINDSLGHEAGDALLAEIATRLRRNLRSSDIVARLGGDEFVVILEHTADRGAIEEIARELLATVSAPVRLSGHECHATASIGIAMFPDHGSDVHTLTKNADMAMYLAKEDGKNNFRFFTKEVKMQSIERLTLENCLRHALSRNEFSLHYQPKVNLATGQITGVEALLRWEHAEHGMLPPGQFIPLAEETGLIVPIGRWALREACSQNMAWQRHGLRPLSMAVNLSPRQFSDENLLHDIDEALAASGMSPALLQIEVTESMMMRNVARAIKVLDEIQGRGIRIAIDDFGTGYSSMSLMKQFPIDTIKIDRSFVRDLPDDTEDRAIAQAIINMGRALEMTIVAEGVETVEQETFLRAHGCDEMQGFLFSRPLPSDQMADLLRPAPQMVAPPLQPTANGDLKQPAPGRSKPRKSARQAAH